MKTLPRRFKNGFQEGKTASKNAPKVRLLSIETYPGCILREWWLPQIPRDRDHVWWCWRGYKLVYVWSLVLAGVIKFDTASSESSLENVMPPLNSRTLSL